MEKQQKRRYPGVKEADAERMKKQKCPLDDEPDWIGNAPNYDKFDAAGWKCEEVLVYLNID